MSNRNKRIKCEVCEKWMRSDKLARHMKIHKDLLSLTSDEMEEELKARHARKLERKNREVKRLQIVATASTLNVSVPSELQDCSLDKGELHQRLRDNEKSYIERIRIGDEIART